jgi:sterol desaturase/sphingolipid hydroxylase (fatty acid hydroxylase superfamily)
MQPVLVVLLAAVAMIGVEWWQPGTRLPRVRGWVPRVALLNAAQVAVVYLGAASWDRWLPQLRWFDAGQLPQPLGVALGYVVITFVFYWWHRARHEVSWLWYGLHQVHHSPARIECAMSFYKHPMEIAINGALSSLVLYVLVGLPPDSAAIVVAITGVAELFYHWNVRTPHWLGYFFQRPEMHRRHHERDWHRSNYSDLPLWDLLFGTFENPRVSPALCGFADDAERQLGRLLSGRRPS